MNYHFLVWWHINGLGVAAEYETLATAVGLSVTGSRPGELIMQRSHLMPAALTTLLLASASGAALAQQAGGSAPKPASQANADIPDQIEVVTVTARRREESLQTVPIPVTVLSANTLLARGITEITDIDRVTPNLSFKADGLNKGAALVALRGVTEFDWGPGIDPKVGIYVDGAYIARADGSVFDLMDIERIEVLRGPQGTLFGRNTPAGLVNVITKEPDASSFYGKVQAGVGNQGQFTGGVMLNVPIISDELALRVSMQTRNDDGWVKNTSTGQGFDNANRQTFRASLEWTPSDDTKIRLTGEYFRAREHGALAECRWNGPPNAASATPADGIPFFAAVWGIYDQVVAACNATKPYASGETDPADYDADNGAITLSAEQNLGFATLTSITSWRDQTDIGQSWGLGIDGVPGANYFQVVQPSNSKSNEFTQEVRLNGSALDDALTWVSGIYYFHENSELPGAPQFFTGVPVPTPAQSPLFYVAPLGAAALSIQQGAGYFQLANARNSSWAGFGELTYAVTPELSITLGARYTEDDRRLIRTQETLARAVPPGFACPAGTTTLAADTCSRTAKFSSWTPRAIVSYNLTPDVMLYTSFSTGYASGGINANTDMPVFAPEKSNNYEAGIKSTWFDRRLTFNATGFWNDYKNEQLNVFHLVDGVASVDKLNVDSAVMRGLEAELDALPLDGWEIQANVGYLDGYYKKFIVQDTTVDPITGVQTTVSRDLSGYSAVNTSPLTAGISTTYTMRLQDSGELAFHFGDSYRGGQYFDIQHTPSLRQSSYWLADARISYEFPNGSTNVALWATNLFDQIYVNRAMDLGLGFASRYFGPPRRFGIQISQSF